MPNLSISRYFADVLDARLVNAFWSWGAIQRRTRRVILRVWAHEINMRRRPAQVAILDDNWTQETKAGRKERERHIALIESGAEAFAVVCHARERKKHERIRIATYEPDLLLRLGSLVRRANVTWAQIEERVPLVDVQRLRKGEPSIDEEVAALRRAGEKENIINAMIKLRIGQGRFRTDVLRLWHGKCCVTGSSTLDALRASHIKSWRQSSKEECRDPRNGLPLIATLDALFDRGLITFGKEGDLLISSRVRTAERRLLGLGGLRLARTPHPETEKFLRWHRNNSFKA
jgi:hypothetical protein